MTISTDRPFAEVVHGATARSHDLSWPPTQPDGTEIVYCIYCGAYTS